MTKPASVHDDYTHMTEERVRQVNALFDKMIAFLQLKNDAALSREMVCAPPVISKMRHGHLPIGAVYIIRIHELTAWPIKDIKQQLGMPIWKPHQDNGVAAAHG